MPKASELLEERPFIYLMFYGDSGTGKSTVGALAPMPFIALSEPQGLPAIAYANPEAEVEIIDRWSDFKSLMKSLKEGKPTTVKKDVGEQPAYRWVWRGKERIAQTLVIDSGTDIQAMCKAVIAGADGDMAIQDWGTLREVFRRVLDDLRRLPMNVVFLALASMDIDDQKKRRIEPALDGSITRAIGQFFSGAAYIRKVVHEGGVKHQACFNLPTSQGYVTKPPPGWPDDVLLLGLDKPGSGTVGSMSLLGAPAGIIVPHDGDDSPEKVESKGGLVEESTKGKKKKPAAARATASALLDDDPEENTKDEQPATGDGADKETGDAAPETAPPAKPKKGRRATKKPAAAKS